MSTLRFLLLLLCGAAVAAAEDSARKLAYEHDRSVWVANLDGTGAKKIAAGIFPDISPDGARVTFNTEEKVGKDGWARHISVVDLAGGKQAIFNDVPSENVAYPKWSPDGAQILFTLFDGHTWHIGLIQADGSGFRYAKKAKESDLTISSPTWAPDGKSFFIQDMKNIYRIDLDGKTLEEWSIAKAVTNGDMSGDGRLDVSPDGKKLLLGVDMNEEAHRKNWDGPLPAVWSLDLASRKATRITSKKLFGWDGCWLDDSTIIFRSQAANEKTSSLYRMKLDGTGLSKALAKDASQPTVSH